MAKPYQLPVKGIGKENNKIPIDEIIIVRRRPYLSEKIPPFSGYELPVLGRSRVLQLDTPTLFEVFCRPIDVKVTISRILTHKRHAKFDISRKRVVVC